VTSQDRPRRGGPGTLALVALGYAAALAAATYPAIRTFASRLPSPNDPLQHLWILRWNASCLGSGRLPFSCPELQYPLGAPLGNFSPLLIQSLLYAAIGVVVQNHDVLIYNILLSAGFLATGLATFLLARHVVGDDLCAAVGGLLGMLAGPVMVHGLGHLELTYLGGVPLFLLAWLRFVDAPTPGRLAAAVGAYALAGACAAYYAVLATVPAAWYVAWRLAIGGEESRGRWLRARAGWLLAFAVAAGPAVLASSPSQVWACLHGATLVRAKESFESCGVPLRSYVTPTSVHALGRALGDPSRRGPDLEHDSYLGVVTLALIGLAATRRARSRDLGFWWSTLALLAILACGSTGSIGPWRVELPAAWLRRHVFAFRLLRSPCRFNLLVATCAAVLAAAGLRRLLERWPSRPARAAIAGGLALLAVADLALPHAPGRFAVPTPPAAYDAIFRRAPEAAVLDAPQFSSGSPALLNALCTYWQSRHHGRTTAGYSGVPNAACDQLIYHPSPFAAEYLASPAYLLNPDDAMIDIVHHASFRDYAWLYLTTHRLDRVVLHQDERVLADVDVRLDRLKAQMADALVFEDPSAAVYDRSRLKPPARAVAMCAEGWLGRVAWEDGGCRLVRGEAWLAVYNPDPGRDLVLYLDAASTQGVRVVRVDHAGVELGRWPVHSAGHQLLATRPFRLPAGLCRLRISEAVEPGFGPPRGLNRQDDEAPCLRVAGVCLKTVPE
jgi:hypothetical protein